MSVKGLPQYLYSFVPIAVSHFLVPPLSYYLGYETLPTDSFLLHLYQAIPIPINTVFDSLVLRLDVEEIKKTFGSTLLTHMFVHADYNHLSSNLYSAFHFGFRVFQELGTFGLYFVFLGGGVLGAAPSPINNFKMFRPSKPNNIFTSIKETLKSMMTVDRIYVGSSGGVSALLGCQLILQISDSYSFFGNLINEASEITRKRLPRSVPLLSTQGLSAYANVLGDLILTKAESFQTLFMMMSISNSINYLNSELLSALVSSRKNNASATLWELARDRLLGKDSINHAAHVQGALFGVSVGLLYLLNKQKKLDQKRRW